LIGILVGDSQEGKKEADNFRGGGVVAEGFATAVACSGKQRERPRKAGSEQQCVWFCPPRLATP
jgi:hypothetical protein